MPKIEEKQLVIKEIKDKLDRALSIVIVDARGLNVEQDTVLRRKLREAGVDYKVYKNSMMTFAVEDTQFAPIAEYLKGPSTIAFSYDEATSAARLIAGELKAMPKLEFKAGIVEGVLYDAHGIEAVAKIPSRDELISKLLGSFKSPMSSFARVINAISEKKAGGGDMETGEVKAADEPVLAQEPETASSEAVASEAPVTEAAEQTAEEANA